MQELVIREVDDVMVHELSERAMRHGRTPAEEAKAILAEALSYGRSEAWQTVDAIHRRLEASGRTFSDSAELLREDRDR